MDKAANIKVPFSTFTGHLKQIAKAGLKEEVRAFLDSCFPEFQYEDLRMKEQLEHGEFTYVVPDYHQPRMVSWGRMRRFAGSPNLGVGRYYSVCEREDGYDRGTLVNEMMTYWNPASRLFPELTDTTLLPAGSRDTPYNGPTLGFAVTQYRIDKTLAKEAQVLETRDLSFGLPLTVRAVTIDKVVDLRIPAVQDWFFQLFSSLEEEAGYHKHADDPKGIFTFKWRGIRNFVDLLPTLVVPGIGGSIFHQAVGAWLQQNGVAGLIFPSARCNARCQQLIERSGKGTKTHSLLFSGWNFVDYRKIDPSHIIDWRSLFGYLATWMPPREAGIIIKRYTDAQPGWGILGAEEGERRRIAFYYDWMLGKADKEPGYDPREGFRRPFYEPPQ